MNINSGDVLFNIANQIKAFENAKSNLAKVLRSINNVNLKNYRNLGIDFKESSLIYKVDPINPYGISFCAVDGGIVQREIASFNIILLRAVAVFFKYIKDKSPYVDFFPEAFPKVDIIYTRITNQTETDQFAALMRIKKEIQTAVNAIKHKHIDILIMDGSLHFYPTDVPNKESRNFKLFLEVVDLYNQLFEVSKQKQVHLIGLIKDSHSNSLIRNILTLLPILLKDRSDLNAILSYDYRNILNRCNDVDLLNYLLEVGERSCIFKIEKNNSLFEHDIYYFYLKSSQYDLPVRIEFINNFDISIEADRLSAALLPIMGHHVEYALPAPLIEADIRARIDSQRIEEIITHIALLSGMPYSLFRKRRERSPFGGKNIA